MLQLAWALVLVANVVALVVYGWDKLKARGNGRRVPERVLLWWIGVGGWIGAWIAMSWFRHKTQKQPFRRWAILWTIVNPTWLLVWWSITSAK